MSIESSARAIARYGSRCRNRAVEGVRNCREWQLVRRLHSESLCTWPRLPRGATYHSPSRLELHRRMSRKKIGLFAAAAVIVVAAVAAGGSDQDVAATEPTPTLAASASASPSPSVAPTASPTSDPTPTLEPTPAPLAGTVVEVVDGDTIRVELPTGIETVRIIGIDTPEVVHPNRARGVLRQRGERVRPRHPRWPGRHPRARSDPGRARPLRPPPRSRPRRRQAVRGRGHRRRLRHPLRLRATEHPRRRAGRRRRSRPHRQRRDLGLMRRPRRPARWSQ